MTQGQLRIIISVTLGIVAYMLFEMMLGKERAIQRRTLGALAGLAVVAIVVMQQGG